MPTAAVNLATAAVGERDGISPLRRGHSGDVPSGKRMAGEAFAAPELREIVNVADHQPLRPVVTAFAGGDVAISLRNLSSGIEGDRATFTAGGGGGAEVVAQAFAPGVGGLKFQPV